MLVVDAVEEENGNMLLCIFGVVVCGNSLDSGLFARAPCSPGNTLSGNCLKTRPIARSGLVTFMAS